MIGKAIMAISSRLRPSRRGTSWLLRYKRVFCDFQAGPFKAASCLWLAQPEAIDPSAGLGRGATPSDAL